MFSQETSTEQWYSCYWFQYTVRINWVICCSILRIGLGFEYSWLVLDFMLRLFRFIVCVGLLRTSIIEVYFLVRSISAGSISEWLASIGLPCQLLLVSLSFSVLAVTKDSLFLWGNSLGAHRAIFGEFIWGIIFRNRIIVEVLLSPWRN